MQMTLQLGLFATMLLIQALLAWRAFAAQRALNQVQTRLANQGEALSLLTDTSENGFGAIARELERLATAEAKPGRRPSTRRVSSAARKGQSVTDIAAAERVSEGEVRLRLSMAGHRLSEMAAGRG
jgi:hypothetical protein